MVIHWDKQSIGDESYKTSIGYYDILIVKEQERWALHCEMLKVRDKMLMASVLDFVKREALRTIAHICKERIVELTGVVTDLVDKQNA